MEEISIHRRNYNLQRFLGLTLLIVLGFLYRLHYLVLSSFRPDSDEAVVGLMAKHILEGQAIPTFYYGQHYMGSLEALLTAGVFSLGGLSIITLKVVPLVSSLVLIVLMYALASSVKSTRAAWIAAALTAVPPGMLVIWSTKARGGFIELMVIGCAALILTTRWVKKDSPDIPLLAAIGLLLGFGWWVNNQIIYFMLVVGYLALSRSRILPHPLRSMAIFMLVGLSAFLIGGLPYWLYNIEHDFVSLEMFHQAGEGNFWQHVQGLFAKAYPILLGARRPWSSFNVFPASTILVCLLYGGVFLGWCIARGSRVFELLRFTIDKKHPEELALLLILACSVVFVCSSFGHLSMEPRYLLPMYIGLFLLVACSLDRVFSSRPSLGSILLLSFLLFHCASLFWNGVQIPGEPVVLNRNRVSKDHGDLIRWLQEHSISWVRTDYWIGHRLAFETNEQVKFVSFGEHRECRVPEYCEKAQDKEALRFMPLILVPDQTRVIKKALTEQGYTFKVNHQSGYAIVYNIKEEAKAVHPLSLEGATITSSHGSESLAAMHDGDLHTRWGSGHHQEDGMWIRVEFSEPQDIRVIRYHLGDWPQDFPRELEIILEYQSGEKLPVFDPESYHHIRYILMGDSVFRFYLHADKVQTITLKQSGTHPVLDWSIAELELFSPG